MVNYCTIKGCSSRPTKDISFHRIPSIRNGPDESSKKWSALRRNMWVCIVKEQGRNEFSVNGVKICSKHFHSGKPADLKDTTNCDWLPSLNLQRLRSLRIAKREVERLLKEERRKQEQQLQQQASESLENSLLVKEEKGIMSTSVQTEMKMGAINEMEMEIRSCLTKISRQREKLTSCGFDESGLFNNDEKTQHLTGLPNAKKLFELFALVRDKIVPLPDSKMSGFQQFIMTLMKLRLDLDHQLLSYLFSIPLFTVTETFYSVLDVLYECLQISAWPERSDMLFSGDLLKDNADCNIVVMFDCVEIPCECPSDSGLAVSLLSRNGLYHSVKYVFGITPQEFISFIMVAAGNASVRSILEKCGFLEKLKPGDVVVTKKENSNDEIDETEFEIDAFVKEKDGLSNFDLRKFKDFSRIEGNCKKIFGSVKEKYKILNGPVKSSMLESKFENQDSVLDEIVIVTSALTNLGKTPKSSILKSLLSSC